MKFLRNLNIGWKFVLAFSISMTLFLASAFIVYKQTENVRYAITQQGQMGEQSVKLTEMGSIIREKDVLIANYIISGKKETIDKFKDNSEQFDKLFKEIKSKLKSDKQKSLLLKIASNDNKINNYFIGIIIPSVDNENEDIYLPARENVDKLRSETVQVFNQLKETVDKDRVITVNHSDQALDQTVLSLVITILLSLIVGITLITFISHSIKKNLNQLISFANEIANGNLNVSKIEYKGKDEIGKLNDSMNRMYMNLITIIQEISEKSNSLTNQSEELTQFANEVSEGSRQIALAMQDLSSGTESQAIITSDLAKTMMEFSNKVKNANKDGEAVAKDSKLVLLKTNDGQELMSTSIHQMYSIKELMMEFVDKVKRLDNQSQEISKLVVVINSIAEQTNLLALNAAIEAARAGEHGKGFAVVADEVRKLAEQVSNSIHDITGIVGNIQDEAKEMVKSLEKGYSQVENGAEQIKVTGETFNEINSYVDNMVKRISLISNSLSEISETTEDVDKSIEKIASFSDEASASIEQTTASIQQASSSIEEITQSSSLLADFAEKLNHLIHKFKL